MKRNFKKKTPIKTKSFIDICRLKTDAAHYGDFYLGLEVGSVYLVHQKTGEPPKASISIPRKVFNRLVTWYVSGKQTKRRIK